MVNSKTNEEPKRKPKVKSNRRDFLFVCLKKLCIPPQEPKVSKNGKNNIFQIDFLTSRQTLLTWEGDLSRSFDYLLELIIIIFIIGSKEFPDSLSLSLSLSPSLSLPIRLYHSSLPTGPPIYTQCPHKAHASKFLLVGHHCLLYVLGSMEERYLCVSHVLFVLIGWFVRWEVSGHVGGGHRRTSLLPCFSNNQTELIIKTQSFDS